jgi:DNA topoisomerase VI subunit A
MLEGKDFTNRYQCIIVILKGHSDLATRSVLHKLSEQLGIPVYGLADYNPAGAIIMLTLKYGSINRPSDTLELATPELRWLCLDSLVRNNPGARRKLNDTDKVMIENLLKGPRPITESERRMLMAMLTGGLKAE